MSPTTPGRNGFQTNVGSAFAKWLMNSRVTKGDVGRLLSDPDLAPIKKLLELDFQSANEWYEKLSTLQAGPWEVSRAVSARAGSTAGKMGVDFEAGGCFERVTLGSGRVVLYKRSIVAYIRYILAFKPFEKEIVYAPVRKYHGQEKRVYTDLHTAEWWWDIQERLPEGATVVPLIIQSDATLLTNHQGDRKAWPVYLSIGNLPSRIRRAQGPGHILLGLFEMKDQLDNWHEAMAELTKGK